MEYATLNCGIRMPMAGIGTFLMTPDEAEASEMCIRDRVITVVIHWVACILPGTAI